MMNGLLKAQGLRRGVGFNSAVLLTVAVLFLSAVTAVAERTVPTMPNACAEESCRAIVATANTACSGPDADDEACDALLTDLARCVQACETE